MDFSADGRYLVAGSGHLSDDNTVRVWDVVTGRQLECFRSRDRVCDYSCVALSPDGSRTVFGSIQGPMVVADIKSGGTWSVDGDDWWGWRRDFPGWPTCAAFSPDGQSFAFGTGGELKRERGYQVLLFLRGSLRSRRFRGEEDEARSIAFSPDNSLVACTAQDGVTRVWSVETGESIQVFEGFGTKCQEAGLTLSFSQDGKTLVRQAGDRTSIFRMENTFRTTPSLRHAEEEEREQSSRGIWRNTYELRRVSTVETMISLRATNKPVAWFPAGLKNCLTINPDSAWATTLDSQLYLLELVTQSGKNSCSV